MTQLYFRDLRAKLNAVEERYETWEDQNTEHRYAWFRRGGGLFKVFGGFYQWMHTDPEPAEFYDWGEEITCDHRVKRPARRRFKRTRRWV